MLTPYLILGVAPEATDDEVRRGFLERIRGTHDAGEQARLTAAYERVSDLRLRVRNAIFGALADADPEIALEALIAARRRARGGPGLDALIAAETGERP